LGSDDLLLVGLLLTELVSDFRFDPEILRSSSVIRDVVLPVYFDL